MYNSLFDPIKELMPLFMLPIAIMLLSTAFRLVKIIIELASTRDASEALMKEEDRLIKEEKSKIEIDEDLQIEIDEDLQKYFNYKE